MGLSQGYGPADDDESVRAIHRALDEGITMLDTAMSYGQGHNERLIGRALAGRRDQAVVATKFGIVRDDHGVRVDSHPGHVRGYCEASLARLGTDVIDLYYLHRIDPGVPVAETVGAMAELVRDGKVRHIGLSEATPGQLKQAAAVHPITAVQFEWSLLWRDPEDDIVPAARRLGTGLVTYSPLGRGLLTSTLTRAAIDDSDFRRSDPRFHGTDLDRNLRQIAMQVEDLRGRVELEVRSALLDVKTSDEQVAVAQQSIALAAEPLKEAQDRYQAGVSGSLEVTQAQEAVANANETYIQALYLNNVAKLSVAYALTIAEQQAKAFLGGK